MVVEDMEDGGEFAVGRNVEDQGIIDLENRAGAEAGASGVTLDGVVCGLEKLSREGLDGAVADFVDVGGLDGGSPSVEGTTPARGKFEITLGRSAADEGILPFAEDVVAFVEIIGEELDFAERDLDGVVGVGGEDELDFRRICAVELGEVYGLADVALVGRDVACLVEDFGGFHMDIEVPGVGVEEIGVPGEESGHPQFHLGEVRGDQVAALPPGTQERFDGRREGLGGGMGASDAPLDGPAAGFFGGLGGAASVGNGKPRRVGIGYGIGVIRRGTTFAGIGEKRFGEGRVGLAKVGEFEEDVEERMRVEGLDSLDILLLQGKVVASFGEEDGGVVELFGSEEIQEEFALRFLGILAVERNVVEAKGLFVERFDSLGESFVFGSERGIVEGDAGFDEFECGIEELGTMRSAKGREFGRRGTVTTADMGEKRLVEVESGLGISGVVAPEVGVVER